MTLRILVGLAAAVVGLAAQDRLPSMPGYDNYQRMAPLVAGAWTSGAVTPRWDADSRAFSYTLRGRNYRFDLATMQATDTTNAPPPAAATPARGRGAGPAGRGQGAPFAARGQVAPPPGRGAEQAQMEMPDRPVQGCPINAIARGRQAFCNLSPDGEHKAFYRDRNFWVANVDGSGEVQLTSDGSEASRIKYGVASWVYGEELSQTTAIWWSPDSRKVAFYRFDESKVQDYYVAMNQTGIQSVLDVEAYPKAGTSNPVPDVLVHDLAARHTTTLDVRDGKPFDDTVVGHYVYNVQWRANSSEVLLNRANRRQQIVEFSACAPASGKCRTIVREEWPTGWIDTDGAPRPRWLSDDTRFVWTSDRNGWTNYYLYDLTGKLLAPLTHNTFDAAGIIKIDDAAGVMFYAARDGDTWLRAQVHRVNLDGTGDVRLTDPAFHHSAGSCAASSGAGCGISPDNKYLIDVFQRHDEPPATRLVDASSGKVMAPVAHGELTRFAELGLRPTEEFTYKAADGVTTLYGQITFPSKFDPAKRYPVLVPVYGGPAAFNTLPTGTFAAPNPLAEYGFLIVKVTYRGVPGTGKRGADALYRKLGQTEMDDMAEGIRALGSRPYVDRAKVGMYGSSYGAYTAAMELVRHPDLFAAASVSSPVTDWRNYDTVYTERFMGLPQDNQVGYDAGSVMTHVRNLRGRMLLYYGTADNNVHPSNSLQLIRALQRAGKSFDLQVGPDQPHSEVNQARMMEFFISALGNQ